MRSLPLLLLTLLPACAARASAAPATPPEYYIMGLVHAPGARPITPGVRLLDALNDASRGLLPIDATPITLCRASTKDPEPEAYVIRLGDLRANPQANVPLVAGDVISVPGCVLAYTASDPPTRWPPPPAIP